MVYRERFPPEQHQRQRRCNPRCGSDHGIAGLYDRREDNGETKLDEQYLSKLYEIADKQPIDFGYPRSTGTQELLAIVIKDLTGTSIHPGTMSRALKMIGARLGSPRPKVGCRWSKAFKKRRLAAIRRAVDAIGAIGKTQ